MSSCTYKNMLNVERGTTNEGKADQGSGLFFSWYNTKPLIDLREFQVYSEKPDNYHEHCLIKAFRILGMSEEKLVKARILMVNNSSHYPTHKLTNLCVALDIKIILYKPDAVHSEHYPTKNSQASKSLESVKETYKIGLVDNHYFAHKKIDYNMGAIKNYDEFILKYPKDWHHRNNDGNIRRNSTTTSYNVIRYMFVNKEKYLTKIPIEHPEDSEGEDAEESESEGEDDDYRPLNMRKEDYIIVAKKQRLPIKLTNLWSKNAKALATEIRMTRYEWGCVNAARQSRAEFEAKHPGLTLKFLKTKTTSRKGMTRGGYIDALIDKGGVPPPITLDADQALAVARYDAPRTMIYAGPGAGKTTTLCYLVASAVKHGMRVLVLAYNVVAEETLAARIKALSVARIRNPAMGKISADAGAAICTFNKFAHRVNRAEDNNGAEDNISGALVDSFRISLETAAKKVQVRGFGAWNLIVVDESQDVLQSHAAIIEGLCARANPSGGLTHLVAAGDPRQELYTGAHWFSDQWAAAADADRINLRYNYRSSPQIVAALNEFSRANFPTLHCDQISARADAAAAAVCIVIIPPNPSEFTQKSRILAVGREIGQALADGEPGECYAVSPVSINKFSLGSASKLARQVVTERRPGVLVSAADDDIKLKKLPPSSYVIATSRKIKGTERSRVVVFGADMDYPSFIERGRLIRLIFVALSRARDELIVVLRSEIDLASSVIMSAVIKLCCSTAALAPSARRETNSYPLSSVAVAGTGISALNGLCTCVGINFSVTPQTLPIDAERLRIELGADCGDADFIGVYSETLVLTALGMKTTTRVVVIGVTNDHACDHGVQYIIDGDGPYFRVITSKGHSENTMRKLAEKVQSAMTSERCINPAYYHAMLRYSLEIGREWTVSCRLSRPEAATISAAVSVADSLRLIAAHVAQLPNYKAGVLDSGFLSYRCHNIPCRRAAGALSNCLIKYEIDAALSGMPIELKHVLKLTDSHRRQAAIYASLMGSSHAVLVNCADGIYEVVSAPELRHVECIARASVIGREARRLAIGPLAHKTIRPLANVPAGCLISVDIEHLYGQVLEIGAVAYDIDNGCVLASFDACASGVIDDDSSTPRPHGAQFTNVWDLTGLRGNATPDASEQLKTQFHAWISRLPPQRAFLHWMGSERELLGPDEVTIDVCRIFHPWLEISGQGRRGFTTLTDAVSQVLNLEYAPHRAFEDAAMTMGVYIAMVNHYASRL